LSSLEEFFSQGQSVDMLDRIALRDYVIEASGDEDFFLQAADLEFSGVELGPTRKNLADVLETRLLVLEKAKQQTGLEIPCLSLSHHNHGGLGSLNEEVREAALSDIRLAFNWARRLGAKIFLLPFFGKGSLREKSARERMIGAMQELCPEAEALGITLAYEGDLAAESIREMSEAIQSRAFGCYYDLANPLLEGYDPVEELKQLKTLVVGVHVKDFKVKLGDCRPGEGLVPLRECAQVLRQMDYQGWLTLETPPARAEVVARDRDYVRTVFL
jgi:sugar phosphate isomerase/epimerase